MTSQLLEQLWQIVVLDWTAMLLTTHNTICVCHKQQFYPVSHQTRNWFLRDSCIEIHKILPESQTQALELTCWPRWLQQSFLVGAGAEILQCLNPSSNQLLFKMHKNHCRVTSLHHCGSNIISDFQVSLRQIWLHVHMIIQAPLLQNSCASFHEWYVQQNYRGSGWLWYQSWGFTQSVVMNKSFSGAVSFWRQICWSRVRCLGIEM